MKVVVKLFAGACELVGQPQVEVELSVDSTVGDLREALHAQHAAIAPLLPHALFAIDTDYATDETIISADAEIACIPPVSGG